MWEFVEIPYYFCFLSGIEPQWRERKRELGGYWRFEGICFSQFWSVRERVEAHSGLCSSSYKKTNPMIVLSLI
jgi:hypothetical protein